jgi:hypothetical protein
MARAVRVQLTAQFRSTVLAESRGMVGLAAALGIRSYTTLSRLIHAPRVRGTELNRRRLEQLANLIGFTGEVYRG